ncbi:MAG: transglycosylase SLT domain-containing protein [Caldilineaceae bacterium]
MKPEQESLPEDLDQAKRIQTENEVVPEWHWLEIEGEATPLGSEETIVALSPAQVPAPRHDDLLIATLSEQEVAVNPGGTAVLQVTLLNNADKAARFHLHSEIEPHATWIDPLLQSILLQPGEGTVLEISLTPPRTSAVKAGDYPLRLWVDAPEYPGRSSELHALIKVTPFREIALGTVQLQAQTVNALRRSVRFACPISNLGNTTTAVVLRGYEQGQHYFYHFANSRSSEDRTATLTLQPGQSTLIYGMVRPLDRAWIGARPRSLRPALLAYIAEEQRAPRSAAFALYDLPIFGIWTVAGLAAAGVVLVMGLVIATVLAASIWWMRQLPRQGSVQGTQIAQPAVVSVTQSRPMVVVVPVNSGPVQLPTSPPPVPVVEPTRQVENVESNPMQGLVLPTATPEVERNAATFTQQGSVALTAPVVNNPANTALVNANGVPVVTAANISAPGVPTAAPVVITQPEANAVQPDNSADKSHMTFAQMFQEIALRYDMNWRMLAAQAYIESGFDSLALGKDGDMGLMQVVPKTWQEFAPQVNVKDPFESYSNTLVAAAYLDYLRAKLGEKGYPQPEWMLVAYNWGPDHLMDFLASGGTWETLDPVRREYAEQILRITKTIP